MVVHDLIDQGKALLGFLANGDEKNSKIALRQMAFRLLPEFYDISKSYHERKREDEQRKTLIAQFGAYKLVIEKEKE